MKMIITFCLSFIPVMLLCQNAYEINVNIEGYVEQELYLGVYYGDKQLVKDTAQVNDQGHFVFSGQEPLDAGVYLLILAPNNDYFQIVINDQDQVFSINTQKDALLDKLSFEGSRDNQAFQDYLGFIKKAGQKSDSLRTKLKNDPEQLTSALQALNTSVQKKQQSYLQDMPESVTALVIGANLPIDIPTYEGSPEEVQKQRLNYYRSHFFDGMDLEDSRLIRTPFFFSKVNEYVEKLHYQVPDSLILVMDQLLGKMEKGKDNFQFFLAHYLTKYANSKLVGMDAVYVHLALNYYGAGKADWLSNEQAQNIIDSAKDLEPLLIGKTAPDLSVQQKDGTKVSLYDSQFPFTIVYFWAYDCGVCKKATPKMKAFYEEYKKRGVQLFAICSSSKGKELPPCWDYMEENEIEDWFHTIDPVGWSKIRYKVRSTPQMYILDKDKKIIMKNIAAEQLPEVMDKLMEQAAKE